MRWYTYDVHENIWFSRSRLHCPSSSGILPPAQPWTSNFKRTPYSVIIINNQLNFTKLLNTICQKPNLKLNALNRASRFLSPEQYFQITNAYIKYIFNYCPLVWMFCYQEIMHKMNKIHKWFLHLSVKDFKHDFKDLLRFFGDINPTKMCKLIINWSI